MDSIPARTGPDASKSLATPGAVASARAEGLRYVTDGEPGIRRTRRGKTRLYFGPDGRAVTAPAELARIARLAIPPAWRDVWICADARGHLQATGRDARGRKQYRYHPRWREHRDATKFDRILEFGRALPRIRRRVAQDLRRPGLPREKVLAVIVRLLETTLVRVGNEEYARANGSFGLTTLRDRHVDVSDGSLRFEFRGKSGIVHRVAVDDPALARLVVRCRDIPGQELFQWIDADGVRRCIDSSDVNDYLREASGGAFTAKDFRTWFATLEALRALGARSATSERQARRHVTEIVAAVAARLGNTPTVCRKCYIHPAVIEHYLERRLETLDGQSPARALRRLLRRGRRAAAPRTQRRAGRQRRATTARSSDRARWSESRA